MNPMERKRLHDEINVIYTLLIPSIEAVITKMESGQSLDAKDELLVRGCLHGFIVSLTSGSIGSAGTLRRVRPSAN